jgi:hypothetical protein
VRHGDKVGPEPECEQHLGRGRDEADDSHTRNDMTELLSDPEIDHSAGGLTSTTQPEG